MTESNLWIKAKSINIQTTAAIKSGFNIGFDKQIPHETREELRTFVAWVESNFNMPITLWVDFEYKHYLIRRDGQRVGYLFYWSDFSSYPEFQNIDDIPEIKLPVRTERSSMEEILVSFIEAITDYFAWICNVLDTGFRQKEKDVEEVLQEYLKFRA